MACQLRLESKHVFVVWQLRGLSVTAMPLSHPNKYIPTKLDLYSVVTPMRVDTTQICSMFPGESSS